MSFRRTPGRAASQPAGGCRHRCCAPLPGRAGGSRRPPSGVDRFAQCCHSGCLPLLCVSEKALLSSAGSGS
uniref:Uncharacterized protein n=1 Tax=Anguilla anguilla TaxID=7936 RepID=A0A0E9RQV1_ANGAN